MSGIMCDLMWSDPKEFTDYISLRDSPRGAGYLFGKEIMDKFLLDNCLDSVMRSHQLVMEG